MREIEGDRGMRRNTILYLLARRFDGIYREFPEPPGVKALRLLKQRNFGELMSRLRPGLPHSGQDVLHGTAFLVQVGWVLMAVFKWVDAFVCW
jgi:hypothetical protein